MSTMARPLALLLALLLQARAWSPDYYPEYCLKDLSQREIPPLSANEQLRVKSLVQVQVLVRHGARTPYAKFSCWKDYDVTWNNCNVTELMEASPVNSGQDRPAPWLFRKVYDGSDNYLGYSCYTGQLISEGYNQEIQVGRYLQEAYLNNPSSSLNLFNTTIWTDINTDEEVYLRSDDEQRTLMSGQILLHTFFNVSLDVVGIYFINIYYDSHVMSLIIGH
jgi:2-phosphoxylose phosphatase